MTRESDLPIAAANGCIPLLEAVRSEEDKTWEKLAPGYGVTNPDPPWKVSLYATCECLAVADALPSLERRRAEDELGETLYSGTPAPEQQLLASEQTRALAHETRVE